MAVASALFLLSFSLPLSLSSLLSNGAELLWFSRSKALLFPAYFRTSIYIFFHYRLESPSFISYTIRRQWITAVFRSPTLPYFVDVLTGYRNPLEQGISFEDMYMPTLDGLTIHGWLLKSPNAAEV